MKNLTPYYNAIDFIISYALKNDPFKYRTTKECIEEWNELVRDCFDDCVEAIEYQFIGKAFDKDLAIEAIETYEPDFEKLDKTKPVRWN